MADDGSATLKTLADFWSAQGKALLEAQQTVTRSLTEGWRGMDGLFAGLADAPRLADLFDIERRSASVMRCVSALNQRNLDHQHLLVEIWTRAGQAYAAASAGQSLEPKQAMALWTEIANRTMVEAQRSDPFLASQRAVIRANTELRIAQGDVSEQIGKQFGLPTRTEMDDVHRSLTEMRRELRRTRRELDALKAATPPEPAQPIAVKPRKKKGR